MRVLLVDDSALVRGILKQVLEDAGFQIVGQASTGLKGVELVQSLAPQLVIMDINMPVMDGLAATRTIMASNPVPILILSSQIEAHQGFDALSAGAMEVMAKPRIADFDDPAFLAAFLGKVRTLAENPMANRSRAVEPSVQRQAVRQSFQLVVMGASTGGPQAVRQILEALPARFPLAIVLVQHLEQDFDRSYVQWLQEGTPLSVRLAEDGEVPAPGAVLVGPVGVHLQVEGNELRYDRGPAVLNQKPAVDVLFQSAARAYGNRTLGVLLTGMGQDGADGCVTIRRLGGHTLVQDAATSAIWGMPRVATERGGASEVLALEAIPSRLIALAGEGR